MLSADPIAALKNAFETYCQVVTRFSRHIRLLYREIESLPKHARDPILTSVQSLTDIFEKLLDRAIKAKEVRKVDTRVAALDLLVAAHVWALHGRLLRSHINIESFTRQQSDILFGGLLEKPTSRIDRKALAEVSCNLPGQSRKGAAGRAKAPTRSAGSAGRPAMSQERKA